MAHAQSHPQHAARSEEEQRAHDHVIALLAQKLFEEGFADVRINPGDSRENAIEIDEEREIYPDVFVVEGDDVTLICEVETPSTVGEGAVEQWRDFATLGPAFLLVVPEEAAPLAQQLLEAHQIPCQTLITYQLVPDEGQPSA